MGKVRLRQTMEKLEERDYHDEWHTFIHEGSMHSLSSIYDRHFNFLFDYGRRFTSDYFLIEDAIQNIFTNLIRSRAQLQDVRNSKNYLVVSFRYELFRLIARSRKFNLNKPAHEVLFVADYSAEEAIEKEESQSQMKNVLLKCLHNLTSKQQEILFLRYDAGLSYEEISNTLHISIESCRTSVYRAIKDIKAELEKMNINGHTLFLYLFTKITGNYLN